MSTYSEETMESILQGKLDLIDEVIQLKDKLHKKDSELERLGELLARRTDKLFKCQENLSLAVDGLERIEIILNGDYSYQEGLIAIGDIRRVTIETLKKLKPKEVVDDNQNI